MVLHFILYHISRATFRLLGDILSQLGRSKRLLLTFGEDQVHWLHLNQRINHIASRYLLTKTLQLPDLIVAGSPMVTGIANRVVTDGRSRHVTD